MCGLSGLSYSFHMSKIVNMHEAKTHFSKLAIEVEAGNEITVARSGKPFMKLVPLVSREVNRPLGLGKAQAKNFDWTLWDSLDEKAESIFRDS